MLKNEKLITRLSFIVVLILALDTLFVYFNNHLWPILNISTFEIFALPLFSTLEETKATNDESTPPL